MIKMCEKYSYEQEIIKLIKKLPDSPTEHMNWLCYNQDFVGFTIEKIKEIKGYDYLKNITVLGHTDINDIEPLKNLYLDPAYYRYTHNGYD